jgi:hypothetical protein
MDLEPVPRRSRVGSSTLGTVAIAIGIGLWLGYSLLGPEGALLGGLAGAAAGVTLDLGISTARDRRTRRLTAADKWASKRGLVYSPISPVFRDTPFLRAGSEQEGRHGFTGEIFGLRGTVYEHLVRYGSEEHVDREDARAFLVLHLRFSLPEIPYLEIRPRHAIAVLDELASRAIHSRKIELESIVLSERCRIEVSECSSEIAVRRVLSPRVIAILADLSESDAFAGGLYVEAEGGKLVFATPGKIDPENMSPVDDLLNAVQPFVLWLEKLTASSSPGGSPSEQTVPSA